MGPYVGQNDQKSTKFFVFDYETWGVQSNGHMVGIIFGIWID
jgi:exonuclease I